MGWIRRIARSLFEAGPTSPEVAGESPKAAATHSEARVRRPETGDTIVAELRRQLVEISNGELPEDAIDVSAPLLDYGYVDSLSAVTLLHFMEERYGVSVAEIDLVGPLNCLDALARHIRSQIGASSSTEAHSEPPGEDRNT